MSKLVNSVVEIGTFGLVDDVTGVKAGEKAASQAGQIQADSAQAGINESRRQFDTTSERLSAAEEANRQALTLGSEEAIRFLQRGQQGQQQTIEDAQAANAAQLSSGADSAVNALRGGERTQFEQLDPFSRAGVSALEQQQALLGLGGQQQQQEAFNQFSDSPGQRFIRDRAQKALLRNSAAIGGLGGGNVRSALVEQGAGFAAQDFGNQFDRLGDLRASGQNAATNIGQAAMNAAGNVASTRFNEAQLTGAGAMNAAANIGQGQLNTAGNIASTRFGTGQQIGAGAINTAARQGQFGAANAANIQRGLQQQGEARASGILGGQQANAQANQGLFQLGGALLGGL